MPFLPSNQQRQSTEGKGGTRTVDINDEQTDGFLNEI